MADQYSGPFITQISATILTDLADSGYDSTATTKLHTAMAGLATLITQVPGQSSYHPNFDHVPPAFVAQLLVEINAIKNAITAHGT